MAKTPDTSAAGYCTVAQLLTHHDARSIGDLVSTNDVRVLPGQLASNAVLLAALRRASGEVESACLVGKRYVPADLAALTGSGAEYLVGLVADLAYWHLQKRKNPQIKPGDIGGAQAALDALQLLRDGERIFSFTETQEAGLPEATAETVTEVEARNGLSFIARRLLGRRANRRDVPREG